MSLRASLTYISVRAGAGLLSVCALTLFVRTLGPEQYGHFALGMAAAALASTVLIMPLNTALARLYADQAQRAAIVGTLRCLVLALGIVFVLLAMTVERVGASWLGAWVLPAAALFAACQGLFDFSAQHANSALEPGRYGRLLITKAVAVIAFGMASVAISETAPLVLLAMALACALSLAVNSRWRPFHFEASLLPRIARLAFPFVVTCALGYALQWGDRYVLARFVGNIDLGRYSALADLTQQTLVLVCSGLGAAWYPRIVVAWGADQREEAVRLMSRYATLGLALVLPAAIGFGLLLAPVSELMFGSAYANMPPMLAPLLVLAAVVGGCKSFYFDIPLLLAERVWWMAAGIALSAIVSLLVMLWAVPRLGIVGAALGLLCGQALGLAYSFAMGRDVLRHRLGRAETLIVCAASLAMAAVVVLLPWSGWIGLTGRALAGAATYGLLLYFLDFDGVRAKCAGLLRGLRS